MKLTPILFVDRIEPSLPFWSQRLGFEKVAEVPEGDHIGFAILVKGAAEVMLQSWDSIEKDIPVLVPPQRQSSVTLFLEVDDFEDARHRVDGCEVVLPERTTFYGMREVGVREPGGHTVILAARVPQPR
jgi:uncharacterized glyoxalase superfamily protein PhnB